MEQLLCKPKLYKTHRVKMSQNFKKKLFQRASGSKERKVAFAEAPVGPNKTSSTCRWIDLHHLLNYRE